MSDQNKREYAIPLLPCHSINKILEFYLSLGFIVTYQQKRPNSYIALQFRDIELHFFAMKEFKPENNYSTCYIILYGIDSVYHSFTIGLKNQMGKLPVKGIPRINPLKDMQSYGVRQFIVVDPAGNYIRIGQPIPKTDSLIFTENNTNSEHIGTPLEKAYELGSRLADGKGDFYAAAKALDKALETEKNPDANQLFKILVLRTDIANRMEESQLAITFLVKATNLLADIDKKILKDDLRLYEEIKDRVAEQ